MYVRYVIDRRSYDRTVHVTCVHFKLVMRSLYSVQPDNKPPSQGSSHLFMRSTQGPVRSIRTLLRDIKYHLDIAQIIPNPIELRSIRTVQSLLSAVCAHGNQERMAYFSGSHHKQAHGQRNFAQILPSRSIVCGQNPWISVESSCATRLVIVCFFIWNAILCIRSVIPKHWTKKEASPPPPRVRNSGRSWLVDASRCFGIQPRATGPTTASSLLHIKDKGQFFVPVSAAVLLVSSVPPTMQNGPVESARRHLGCSARAKS